MADPALIIIRRIVVASLSDTSTNPRVIAGDLTEEGREYWRIRVRHDSEGKDVRKEETYSKQKYSACDPVIVEGWTEQELAAAFQSAKKWAIFY